MALAEQRGSIRRVRQNHVKSLRGPLTDGAHQEVAAKLVDPAFTVEADNAVSTGQQDKESAGSLNSEEEHPLGPAGDRQIADDRRTWRGLSNGGVEW
jgi:hypothetical protein